MKEFFGIGGYTRPADGYLSWQHLAFVSSLMVLMVLAAILLGMHYQKKSDQDKNKVLIVSAVLIDAIELFKIVFLCFRHEDPWHWLYELPLFLCSIMLITLPLAAFSKGRIKEASLDFVMIFGVLGAVLGTYGAGQNYACYPVLSFDNVVSGVTHSISGFAALYILIVGMASMKRKNISLTFCIMVGFCILAYIANIFTDSNYMFLSRGDGTPYDIVFNWVSGNPILYPLSVLGLFLIYIVAFYFVYYQILKKTAKKETTED